MLTVKKERWLAEIKSQPWADFDPGDIATVIGALKQVVPVELHGRIDKAVVKARRGEGDAQEIFIILDGNRETGEQLVFEIMSGPMDSPDHIHGESPDVDYGEMYWTLAGEINDVSDEGHAFTHKSWMEPAVHGRNTRHKPHVRHWWIGVFYHPAASRLAA